MQKTGHTRVIGPVAAEPARPVPMPMTCGKQVMVIFSLVLHGVDTSQNVFQVSFVSTGSNELFESEDDLSSNSDDETSPPRIQLSRLVVNFCSRIKTFVNRYTCNYTQKYYLDLFLGPLQIYQLLCIILVY